MLAFTFTHLHVPEMLQSLLINGKITISPDSQVFLRFVAVSTFPNKRNS